MGFYTHSLLFGLSVYAMLCYAMLCSTFLHGIAWDMANKGQGQRAHILNVHACLNKGMTFFLLGYLLHVT